MLPDCRRSWSSGSRMGSSPEMSTLPCRSQNRGCGRLFRRHRALFTGPSFGQDSWRMPPASAPAQPSTAGTSLVGVVERVLLHKPDTGYTVLRLTLPKEGPAVVVGVMPLAEVGELLRAEGDWYQDKVWGRQFRAKWVQLEPPASEEGLVAFFGSGRIKGVAEAGARRLVRRFGLDLPKIIESTPDRLREIPGGAARSRASARSWSSASSKPGASSASTATC